MDDRTSLRVFVGKKVKKVEVANGRFHLHFTGGQTLSIFTSGAFDTNGNYFEEAVTPVEEVFE